MGGGGGSLVGGWEQDRDGDQSTGQHGCIINAKTIMIASRGWGWAGWGGILAHRTAHLHGKC